MGIPGCTVKKHFHEVMLARDASLLLRIMGLWQSQIDRTGGFMVRAVRFPLVPRKGGKFHHRLVGSGFLAASWVRAETAEICIGWLERCVWTCAEGQLPTVQYCCCCACSMDVTGWRFTKQLMVPPYQIMVINIVTSMSFPLYTV